MIYTIRSQPPTRERPLCIEYNPDLGEYRIIESPIDFYLDRMRYSWDEQGFSNLFADMFKDIARYVDKKRSWFVYDGKIWVQDDAATQVAKLAKSLVVYLWDSMDKVDTGDQLLYSKFIKSLKKLRNRSSIINDASTIHNMDVAVFDRQKHLFNCQNGTFNLETGELQHHNSYDFITLLSNVVYDIDASCDRWTKFTNEVMMDRPEMVDYLQRALGYSLTGETWYECFFILIGKNTRNGKGTTTETIVHLMGTYARTAQPDTIRTQHTSNGSAPSEDIARLKGARFVSMSEPDKNMQMNAARVKQLTGNDTVTARPLYEKSFEFYPEYKLFLSGNYLPNVNDPTLFASDRIKLIPFERHFGEEERDTNLKSFFKDPQNISGIFNWMYKGYQSLRKIGLALPEYAKQSIRDYYEESDIISTFVKETYVKCAGAGASIPLRDVYNQYLAWTHMSNMHPVNYKNFAREMRSRYILMNVSNAISLYGFMEKEYDVEKLLSDLPDGNEYMNEQQKIFFPNAYMN